MTDDYVRTDPLEKRKVPKVPHAIVETFTTDQMTDLMAASPAPLGIYRHSLHGGREVQLIARPAQQPFYDRDVPQTLGTETLLDLVCAGSLLLVGEGEHGGLDLPARHR